jgi:hypothetical protein
MVAVIDAGDDDSEHVTEFGADCSSGGVSRG